MSKKKLKPCPFCGGECLLTYHRGSKVYTEQFEPMELPYDRGYYSIGCSTPDCILYYDEDSKQGKLFFKYGSKDEAIKRWNRRG